MLAWASGFPWTQMMVLALVRVPDPVLMSSIFPYIFFMTRDFHVADSDDEIGRYSGYIAASYSVWQGVTMVFWGRMADRWGRKPVLLIGLLCSAIAAIWFGMSTSLPMAIAARSFAGVMNGNAGVVSAMVPEMLPDPKYEGIAYVVIPIVWGLGYTVGPLLGGALADPARQYPGSALAQWGLVQRYKYILPNLVVAGLQLVAFVLSCLVLRETHPTLKHRRDWGLELIRWVRGQPRAHTCNSSISARQVKAPAIRPPWRGLLKRGIVLSILAYMLLGFHEIGYDETFPVYASTPTQDGGLSMTPRLTGLFLGGSGLASSVCQIVLFPYVQSRLGNLLCLRGSFAMFVVNYAVMPVLDWMPKSPQGVSSAAMAFLVAVFALRTVAAAFSFPVLFILINHAAGSFEYVVLVNSVSQTMVALSRSLAPVVSGNVLSSSLHLQKPFLWLFLTVIAAVDFVIAILMNDPGPIQADKSEELTTFAIDDDESVLEEAHEPMLKRAIDDEDDSD